MSDFNLLSFPGIESASNAREYCELYSDYPFFDNSDDANPNMTGLGALLVNGSEGKVVSYNYFCPYDMLVTYSPGFNDLFRVYINGTGTLTPESGITTPSIYHQIIEYDEIIASGKNLINEYDNKENFWTGKTFNVEYITKDFEQIEKINKYAFSDLGIVSVRLPYNESGLTIDDCAFSDNTSLIEFYNYHTVKEVGDGAFSGCTMLSGNEITCDGKIALTKSGGSLRFGENSELEGWLKICFDCGDYSFKKCTNLSKIAFYDGSDTPDDNYLHSKLVVDGSDMIASADTSNHTPFPCYFGLNRTYSSPKYRIGKGAFMNCTNLSEINGYKIDARYSWDGDFGGRTLEYCYYAKKNTASLVKIFIPETLDLSNADYCFANCTSLTGTCYFEDIYENVKIPDGAFSGCTGITYLDNLSSYKFPNATSTYIGDSAFEGTSISPSNQRAALQEIAVNVADSDIIRIFGS